MDKYIAGKSFGAVSLETWYSEHGENDFFTPDIPPRPAKVRKPFKGIQVNWNFYRSNVIKS